jgi:hypothetical protein
MQSKILSFIRDIELAGLIDFAPAFLHNIREDADLSRASSIERPDELDCQWVPVVPMPLPCESECLLFVSSAGFRSTLAERRKYPGAWCRPCGVQALDELPNKRLGSGIGMSAGCGRDVGVRFGAGD